MRPTLQEQSALKLAGRIIRKAEGIIPQLALGINTRDFLIPAIEALLLAYIAITF
jgi:hypothetical protein